MLIGLRRRIQGVWLDKRSFVTLVKRYGLKDKIDIKLSSQDGCILTQIISPEGNIPEIPGGFIGDLLNLVFQGKRPWGMDWSFFRIGSPKTLQEIKNEIESASLSCELAWQAADG